MINGVKHWGLSTFNKEDGWDDCVYSIISFNWATITHSYITSTTKKFHRHPNTFHVLPCRTEYFKNSFFPHVINEWNKLDRNIRSSSNYQISRKAFLKFLKSVGKKIFNINDPFGINMLTRLKLGFSHLREHKFRHGFKDTLSQLCSCSIKAETTTRDFLCCHFYNSNRATLMNDSENIPISFLRLVITI